MRIMRGPCASWAADAARSLPAAHCAAPADASTISTMYADVKKAQADSAAKDVKLAEQAKDIEAYKDKVERLE